MTTAVLLLTLYLTNGLFAAVVLTVLTATIIIRCIYFHQFKEKLTIAFTFSCDADSCLC